MRYIWFVLVVAACLIAIGGCSQAATPKTATPDSLSKIAHVKGAAANSDEQFKFIVIGDRNGGNIPGLWPKAIEEINLLKPEFVMSVGDFVAGYTEDVSELDRQWTEFLAEMSQIGAPFFFIPGNHDETNAVMRGVYLKRFAREGRSYYSFNYKGCHFTVLDSTLFIKQGIDPNQLEWFKADMTAAKGAEHVFLFYHHPANERSAVWKQIAPLLTLGKATVFNGHTHWMSYAKQNGIDTYTLGATAAENGDSGPDFGNFEMFAYVTFGAGKATVAALTVGEVRSGKHVDRVFAAIASPLPGKAFVEQEPTATGRKVTVTQPNSSQLAFDLAVTFNTPGYTVKPWEASLSVKPGQTASASFEMNTCSSQTDISIAPSPKVLRKYTFTNPAGEKAILSTETTLGRFSTIEKGTGIKVDGKLDDWAAITAETLPPFGNLLTEGANWGGDQDFSSQVKLACDDSMLYMAVDVIDDNLRTGLTPATENDGFGLTWSVPVAWRSSEPNMPVTGSVRLIPTAGQVTPIWAVAKNLRKPAGFNAVASRTEHGYTCEVAIPWSDIGATSPVKASQLVNWRLQFRDIDDPKKPANVFTVGGTTEPKESAQTWITGVVK